MYFDVVKGVLDQSIPTYGAANGLTQGAVDAAITAHIVNTSNEHRNPNPNINYDDPLCRLAYLYVHTAANATLFERTIRQTTALTELMRVRDNGPLNIVTVGGGPGTELLGLAKYLRASRHTPTTWDFTVLDRVPHWGETWAQLADGCRAHLAANGNAVPVINRGFFPMDVTNPASYAPYAWLFARADVIVFNYLLSENQVRLAHVANAVALLERRAQPHAYFVFIDRLEYQSTFVDEVKRAAASAGLVALQEHTFNTRLSSDEQVSPDLGTYPARFGNRRPRTKFYTSDQTRWPGAFSLVTQKQRP